MRLDQVLVFLTKITNDKKYNNKYLIISNEEFNKGYDYVYRKI